MAAARNGSNARTRVTCATTSSPGPVPGSARGSSSWAPCRSSGCSSVDPSRRIVLMLGIHDYWLFVASGILLNLVPGQDTLYILGSSIAQGRRIGVASALGISAGCVVHTLAAALGLSAILATSAAAFVIVKLAGAAYL